VALQLAAMGLPSLQLIDPEEVEVVNLACQGYFEADVGMAKVKATAELCRRSNPAVEVLVEVARFRRTMDVGNVLFCCVDDIEVRQHIWEAVHQRVQFFADGRMSAKVVRVLAAADSDSRRHYPTTLFAATEAYQGACTAKSTVFTGNIAAGLMLSQFSKWLRRLPVERDLTVNLLSAEWSLG
jgi:sulfur carrier protein ThiS adenylyltransferase